MAAAKAQTIGHVFAGEPDLCYASCRHRRHGGKLKLKLWELLQAAATATPVTGGGGDELSVSGLLSIDGPSSTHKTDRTVLR
jgi:hypothetical protein